MRECSVLFPLLIVCVCVCSYCDTQREQGWIRVCNTPQQQSPLHHRTGRGVRNVNTSSSSLGLLYCMKRSRFGLLCELIFRLKVCLYKQFCHEIWLEPNGTLVPPGLIGRAKCRLCVCVCVCVHTTNTSKFLTDVHVKNGNENPRVGYNVCILDEVKPFLLALS